jgi:Uma2 family endonuclease
MRVNTRATIEDLYQVDGKAELVHGEIIEIPPAGEDPGRASLRVAARLLAYEERTGTGRAYPDGMGFEVNLPHRKAFSPDAAYHIGPRMGMQSKPALPRPR